MGFSVKSSALKKTVDKLRGSETRINTGLENIIREMVNVGQITAEPLVSSAYVDVGKYGSIRPDITLQHGVQKSADGITGNVGMLGPDAPFIEFGAGVHINVNRTYPGERPGEIVGLGQYGKGFGNRKAWGFYQVPGDRNSLYVTFGTPMQHPMYDTAKAMRDLLNDKVKIEELMK